VPGEDRQQGGDGSLEAPLRGRRRSARHALGIWRLVAFITTTDALVQIGFCLTLADMIIREAILPAPLLAALAFP
jgi:hypothetical protein